MVLPTIKAQNQHLSKEAYSSSMKSLQVPVLRALGPRQPLLPSCGRLTSLDSARRTRYSVTVASQKGDSVQSSGDARVVSHVKAAAIEDDDSPYLEPLLRNLVLGATAGVIAEIMHVVFTASEVAGGAGGVLMLPALLPAAYQALAPLFVWDHAVAIVVWVLLYSLEANTVDGIIRKHSDPTTAAQALRSTMTLPKRILPLSMSSIKRQLYKVLAGVHSHPAGVSTTTSAAGGALPDVNAFTPIDFARELERRERANAPSSNGTSVGTATLERPPVLEPKETETEEKDTDVTETEDAVADVAPPPPTTAVPRSRRASLKRNSQSGSGLRPLQLPQLQPQMPKESKRDQELRERKAYLKNFWYAVGTSASLKADKPMEVKILGRSVVLYRDENGKARCMENLCAHRGAPLGQGWTKHVDGHKCVVCPYHAWAFDKEGRLVDVPTQVRGALPKRPLQQTYPVEEKGGFIWLFFGSKSMPAEERPPIPWIPELNDRRWRAVYGEMEFKSPHWSTFDNALDMAHIHYVHNGSFGNPNKPEILDMNVERDTFGLTGSFKIHNKPVNKLWEWTSVPHVPVELKAFLPMTSAVRITLGRGIQMITFVNTVPIDENTSVNRFCLIRNFAIDPKMDMFVRDSMMTILTEDKVMVETVRPDELPREFSLAADMPQIAFRKLRQEWVDMGYAVDPNATTGPHGSLNM